MVRFVIHYYHLSTACVAQGLILSRGCRKACVEALITRACSLAMHSNWLPRLLHVLPCIMDGKEKMYNTGDYNLLITFILIPYLVMINSTKIGLYLNWIGLNIHLRCFLTLLFLTLFENRQSRVDYL